MTQLQNWNKEELDRNSEGNKGRKQYNSIMSAAQMLSAPELNVTEVSLTTFEPDIGSTSFTAHWLPVQFNLWLTVSSHTRKSVSQTDDEQRH